MTYLLGAFGILWAVLNIVWAYIFHRETLNDSAAKWLHVSGYGIIGMITPNISEFFEVSNMILKFLSSLFGAVIVAFGAWKAYKETFKNVKNSTENDK